MQRVWCCAAVIAAMVVIGRPAFGADEFAPPKPGPELEMLKKLEGKWDATTKFKIAPDKPEQESKGTMTYKMVCGGLWLSSDFEGEFGGQKFQGKGLDTYDSTKKKYTMIWVDSMATTPMIGEGTFDKESKTLTYTSDYPGPDGKMAKHKIAITVKDEDNMEMKMSVAGEGGKEMPVMTITYKRKK